MRPSRESINTDQRYYPETSWRSFTCPNRRQPIITLGQETRVNSKLEEYLKKIEPCYLSRPDTMRRVRLATMLSEELRWRRSARARARTDGLFGRARGDHAGQVTLPSQGHDGTHGRAQAPRRACTCWREERWGRPRGGDEHVAARSEAGREREGHPADESGAARAGEDCPITVPPSLAEPRRRRPPSTPKRPPQTSRRRRRRERPNAIARDAGIRLQTPPPATAIAGGGAAQEKSVKGSGRQRRSAAQDVARGGAAPLRDALPPRASITQRRAPAARARAPDRPRVGVETRRASPAASRRPRSPGARHRRWMRLAEPDHSEIRPCRTSGDWRADEDAVRRSGVVEVAHPAEE